MPSCLAAAAVAMTGCPLRDGPTRSSNGHVRTAKDPHAVQAWMIPALRLLPLPFFFFFFFFPFSVSGNLPFIAGPVPVQKDPFTHHPCPWVTYALGRCARAAFPAEGGDWRELVFCSPRSGAPVGTREHWKKPFPTIGKLYPPPAAGFQARPSWAPSAVYRACSASVQSSRAHFSGWGRHQRRGSPSLSALIPARASTQQSAGPCEEEKKKKKAFSALRNLHFPKVR